jgi:beta-lactamase regulating signal transducer with metallopeptidase domain/tetratricopeptide (TPR) repeat protein
MIGPTSWLLLTLTVQVTVLAIAIGAIQKFALGRHPKAAAMLIAFGMLLLLAVTAAVAIPLPSWFDLLDADSSQTMASRADVEELMSVSSISDINELEFISDTGGENYNASASHFAWAEVVKNVANEFDGSATGSPVVAKSMTWNGVVCFGVCFLSLCVFGFGRLLLGFLSLRQLRLNSKMVSCETTLAMSNGLCRRIGCEREIELLSSPVVGTAATIGLWKPKIFLAEDFGNWEQAEQESVLAHEIAHIHHGDFAANILSQICTSMHFFNPAVHWLVGQMRLKQEVAADQVASNVTSGPREYARSLAVIALRQDNQSQLRLASMFIPNQNSFARRIKLLHRTNRSSAASVHRATILVTLVSAFAICGIRSPASTAENVERNGVADESVTVVQEGIETQEVVDDATADEGTQSADSETVDSSGTEEVHEAGVQLAQQLIRKNRADGFDEFRHAHALELLRDAIDANPENIRAKVNLVDLYLTRARSLEQGSKLNVENLKQALKWLESLTAVKKFTRMEQVLAMPQLVYVYDKLGEDAKAEHAVVVASHQSLAIAKLNPDIYEIWFSMVQCATVVKDYELANEFIRTAYQSVTKQEIRQKLLQLSSLIYLQNADDFIDISTEKNFRKRLYALCKAISTNPRDVKIYDRLTEYLDVEVDPDRRDVWLRNSIIECPIPGVVHILIGAREILRGDVVAGKTNWEIGQHQFGTMEFVTHRLLSVAIRKHPKYGEGKLLDTAISVAPNQYMLYETRGVIKKREAILLSAKQNQEGAREKFDEAIEDLKVVVEKMPELITANKHLQDCYEKIGDVDNVAVHTKRVQDKLDKVDEERRALYEKVLDDLTEADASPLVLNQLGNAALIRKEFSEAIRYYEKARKKSPKDAAILNNLAYTYLVAEDGDRNPELAVQLVDEAIDNLPSNIAPREMARFQHTKATALKQLDRLKEALPLFERVLKDLPDHADSLKSVIECYRALNIQTPEQYVERLEKIEHQKR